MSPVDGEPHPFVVAVAPSPWVDRDGTLFAFALGAGEPFQNEDQWGVSFSNAIYRSTNRGLSWEPVLRSPIAATDIGSYDGTDLRILTHKPFVESGRAMMLVQSHATYRSNPQTPKDLQERGDRACRFFTTTDHGATWQARRGPILDSLRYCGAVSPRGGTEIVVRLQTGRTVAITRDLGENWNEEIVTAARPPHPPDIRPLEPDRPGAGQNPEGLWVRNVDLGHSDTDVHCEIEIDAVFFPTTGGPAPIREHGCAIGEVSLIVIRERRLGAFTGLWVEDDASSPDWLLIRAERPEPSVITSPRRISKADDPWTGPPDRISSGMLQRTWAGLLLRVPRPDGPDWIVSVLYNDGEATNGPSHIRRYTVR
ncbi:MAG: sialidase family protein [Chloroflexota bacterium]